MRHNIKQTGLIALTILFLSIVLLRGNLQHTSGLSDPINLKQNSNKTVIDGNFTLAGSDGKHTSAMNQTTTDSIQNNRTVSRRIVPLKPKGYFFTYLASQSKGVIGLYDGNQSDNPTDNIFNVKLDCQPTINDKVWLTYHLAGVFENCGVACSINDRLAFGGYLVKKDTATTLQRVRLNPAWLHKGENHILFGLAENSGYGYRVSDLAIEVEQNTEANTFVVNASRNLYNGKAYLHGFLQGMPSEASVRVDGSEVALHNGEFETIVTPKDKQQTEIKVEINGLIYSRVLDFGTSLTADKELAQTPYPKCMIRNFEKGKSNKLATKNAILKVDYKTLITDKLISLTPLRPADIPSLDLGMTNVTANDQGFRFLPHGEHFSNKGATVLLKYDRTKIPDGYTENDIRTFYFDQNTRHWVALKRDTVDQSICMVISKTTHFTDMINGVIKTPESPQTEGFAPTMMNDIKAADPTSKIELIAPPSANNQGSANLSYNLEMPPARNGMSPQIAITYNSDGGSGWLGKGWDLNIPSITLDTRWGVPRYNDSIETETYSLSGSTLITTDSKGNNSVAHRGDKILRVADRQFYPRVEGNYSKIIRKGTAPGNYYWEVTDKNGTKYTYGGYDSKTGNNASLVGTITTIKGESKMVSAE